MYITQKCAVDDIFSYGHYKMASQKTNPTPSVYMRLLTQPKTVRLIYGKRNKQRYPHAIIRCYDHRVFQLIAQSFNRCPSSVLTLLMAGLLYTTQTLIITLDEHYIERSIVIDMGWSKRLWSLQSREHMIAITGVYYSVLGGAFCSLGKDNSKYAYKAGALAIQQIRLARRLKDPVLETKCWLYFAEDLIQLGKVKKANKIIKHQMAFVENTGDLTLCSMLKAVIGKMNIALEKKQKQIKNTIAQ